MNKYLNMNRKELILLMVSNSKTTSEEGRKNRFNDCNKSFELKGNPKGDLVFLVSTIF